MVCGAEWGRVRALLDDKGRQIKLAGPSAPVEILGLGGVPSAGEPFVVVENEGRAREVSEFRTRKIRDQAAAGATAARGTLEQMLTRIAAGAQKEVAVVIKADVQGSAEAIQATVLKLEHEEVRVRVLNAAVGQITESDVQLAKASNAVIVAFNVRATSQARELAHRDGVDIRYYSIIYQVADDIEQLVRGKIAPKYRENFLGYAEIRKVFDITKTGKVAGCMITKVWSSAAAACACCVTAWSSTRASSASSSASRTTCAKWPAATSAACRLRDTTICARAMWWSATKASWSRLEVLPQGKAGAGPRSSVQAGSAKKRSKAPLAAPVARGRGGAPCVVRHIRSSGVPRSGPPRRIGDGNGGSHVAGSQARDRVRDTAGAHGYR